MRHHHHGPHCGCPKCPKKVVHPVKENVVHHCTEETVKHIHPSHTTVMNHHLVKNKHVFPHSTSVANTYNSVDEYGGSFNIPGNQVGGAMSPGMGYGNQVGGAMSPGYGGYNNHNHVGGAMHPGKGMHHHCKKPNKWC